MASPAPALATLKRQLLERFPAMGSANIGIMADKRHIEGGTSDHILGNAIDIPVAGGPGAGAEHLALVLALLDDPRAHYAIYDRVFYHKGRAPARYTGTSPHTAHAHLSINPERRADAAPWRLTQGMEADTVKVIEGAPGRVWRLKRGDDRLYRTSEDGINAALAAGYELEGPAFDLHGDRPVHSLEKGGSHILVVGEEESALLAQGWTNEGEVGRSADTGEPVYRLRLGAAHLHTANKAESDAAQKAGWQYEGIAFYTGTVPAPTDCAECTARFEGVKQAVYDHAQALIKAVQ